MKRVSSILSVLIILGVISWSFSDLKPTLPKYKSTLKTDFSLDNALFHLKNISEKPHFVGSENHKKVQDYIVTE